MSHRLPVLFVGSFGNSLCRSDVHSGYFGGWGVVFVTKQISYELKLRREEEAACSHFTHRLITENITFNNTSSYFITISNISGNNVTENQTEPVLHFVLQEQTSFYAFFNLYLLCVIYDSHDHMKDNKLVSVSSFSVWMEHGSNIKLSTSTDINFF